MKRRILIGAAFILSILGVSAQPGVIEAHKFAQKDLRGTARYMSLAGAMGARGGDISAVAINPAGIGMYGSSEVVTTLDFQSVDTKTTFMKHDIGSFKEDKFKVGFNNLGFVGTFPLYNDVAPLLNFGFSYNKQMSFERKSHMVGDGLSNPFTEYMAARANGRGYTPGDITLPGDLAGRDDLWRFEDWLPILGSNSHLISYQGGQYVTFDDANPLLAVNELFLEEKGSINTYDFNMGTTFSNIISAGLTVSMTDIDYKMYSTYKENFIDDSGSADKVGGYDLNNGLRTEGTGWKLGLGVIFKPIDELRIGIAYHSPTWYNISSYYYSDLIHDLNDLKNTPNMHLDKYTNEDVQSMDGDLWSRTDYKFRTPDKWIFSLSAALGKVANISVDYELVDYTKSNFSDRRSWEGIVDGSLNGEIKDFYKLTSSVRTGIEFSLLPSLFGRVGYAWQQNPYSDEFKDFINPEKNLTEYFHTPGAIHQYVVDGDIHHITWGLGYRISRNVYADVAFVYKTQKSDLYAYSMADVTELKQNTFQGALTLGFRF